ncbi:cysteine hydrolase family protein [Labilibacter marinus]|uniref:cysteine hydrolase family protein n=1 Tax=Labilibacter marinus TaxID=1477105 RepID=UPI00082BC981|nr:cysteine hydrolase family protein [Labilibacter marinus]
MSLVDKKAALLLIDLQEGFKEEDYWGGKRNNPNAEKICAQILERWRALSLPVYHIRHSSDTPVSKLHASYSGFAFMPETAPIYGEVEMVKNVNSAFIGTKLKEHLDAAGITTLVIVGLTTNHCISTTTRMAGNYGYETYVVSDATATFPRKGINGELYDAETIHLTALASLNEEFATVLSKDKLLELL